MVLAFVQDHSNLDKLKAAFDIRGRVFTPSDDQRHQWHKEMHNAFLEQFQLPDGEAPELLYPSLHRDTGAKILHLVAAATEPVPIVKEVEFIADTSLCEWAYVVDLDIGTLEVYAGKGMELRLGQHAPRPPTRFGEAQGIREGEGPELVAEWKLERLPDEDEFLQATDTSEGEEDEGEEEEEEEEGEEEGPDNP